MIVARVSESENRVYVDVNGYISKKDAKDFLLNYKKMVYFLYTIQGGDSYE